MEKATKQMSEHARAAKAIRAELKAAFKGVKFSVTSQSFSMGNSVNVSWTNGPSREEVDALVDKYQYGHFDGMTDSFVFSNKRDDLPQTKFVMTTRYEAKLLRDATSKEVQAKIEEATGLNLGDKFEFIK